MPASNPTASALVLIEFQNEFLAPEGKLNAPVADVVRENRVIERGNELIATARSRGVPVVFVKMEFEPGHAELPAEPYGILKLVADTRAFERGSKGAELHPDVDRRDGDVVVTGKRTISAFDSTNLQQVLTSLGAQRVFLCGQLTNLCVESTMRSAYDRGFDVVTVTDAMSTLSMDLHETAVQHVFGHFSKPIVSAQFAEALDAGAVGAA